MKYSEAMVRNPQEMEYDCIVYEVMPGMNQRNVNHQQSKDYYNTSKSCHRESNYHKLSYYSDTLKLAISMIVYLANTKLILVIAH